MGSGHLSPRRRRIEAPGPATSGRAPGAPTLCQHDRRRARSAQLLKRRHPEDTGPDAGKRVLMICYAYPPISVAGSVRSAAFASRLPAFGWQPLVLSVRNARDPTLQTRLDETPDAKVVRTYEWNLSGVVDLAQGIANRPFKIAGRPLRRNVFRDLLCMPDDQVAWLSTLPAWWLSRSADVIYASCSPFSSAVSAAVVKRLTGRPLVIDFRDPWLLNSYARWTAYQRFWVSRLERLVIGACDRLILNTPGAEAEYRRAYPTDAHKFVTIPNGYDELNLSRGVNASPFCIVHVGTFYGTRSPRALLEALAALRNPEIEFVHVGPESPELAEFAGRVRIRALPWARRDAVLEIVRNASLLYLKQGREPGVARHLAVASKTYEYLATGLPILADCPPGDNAEIIARYASRAHVVTSGEVADLRAAVERAFAERSTVEPRVSDAFVRDFDRRRLTGALARVLDEVAGREASHSVPDVAAGGAQ
jgi:glycosyltransferase involved in cell wall biosynthesis